MKPLIPALWALSLLFTVSAASAEDADTVATGHKVFTTWCAACHGPGRHTPGTMALWFKYNGSPPPLLELRDDLDADTLGYFIRNGVSVMPSFRKSEISDSDIVAIADYLQASAAAAKRGSPNQ